MPWTQLRGRSQSICSSHIVAKDIEVSHNSYNTNKLRLDTAGILWKGSGIPRKGDPTRPKDSSSHCSCSFHLHPVLCQQQSNLQPHQILQSAFSNKFLWCISALSSQTTFLGLLLCHHSQLTWTGWIRAEPFKFQTEMAAHTDQTRRIHTAKPFSYFQKSALCKLLWISLESMGLYKRCLTWAVSATSKILKTKTINRQ